MISTRRRKWRRQHRDSTHAEIGHQIPAEAFLQGLSSILFAIAGLSFFFGGRAIHEIGGIDRTLAEIVGIGVAFIFAVIGVIAKHKIEDLEWKAQNEEAENQQKALEQMKESHPDSSRDVSR